MSTQKYGKFIYQLKVQTVIVALARWLAASGRGAS